MKKYLFLLMALISTSVFSSQVVNVVWPFAVGSSQANMVRSLIESANLQQEKYKFVFLSKPGAGGTVAARHALDSKELNVLISSSSFYIRPMLYKDSHEIEKFNLIGNVCLSQPLAIYSKKITNITSATDITLGVIPGSITTLVSRTIQRENKHLVIREIPYKGTPEATTDMLGGHVDGSVDFIGNSTLSRFDNTVSVLGITGKREINGYKPFHTKKIRGLEDVTNDYFIFADKTMPEELQQEFYNIFSKSISVKVKESCEDDFGYVRILPYNEYSKVHSMNAEKWTKITHGILKE